MKRPIKPLLQLAPAMSSEEIWDTLQFELPYAVCNSQEFGDGFLISQTYSNHLCFVELLEISVKNKTAIRYTISEFAVFLFFMLEGCGTYTTEDGVFLSHAPAGRCYLATATGGEYVLNLEPGRHTMVYISPRIEWVLRNKQTWPMLTEFVIESQLSRKEASFLAKIPIGRSIGKCLFHMWRISDETDDVELQLITRFKELLQIYLAAVDEIGNINLLSSEDKVEEINRYLALNFRYTDITDSRKLCEKFLMTERTLRRVFRSVNGVSITSYVNAIRIRYAQKLLSETDLSLMKICIQCGFRSVNYFGRIFRQYSDCSPSQYRDLSN